MEKRIIRVATAVPKALDASLAPIDQPRNSPLEMKIKVTIRLINNLANQRTRLIAKMARLSPRFSALSASLSSMLVASRN